MHDTPSNASALRKSGRRLVLNLAAFCIVVGTGEAVVRSLPEQPAGASHHVYEPGRTFRFASPPRGPEARREYDVEITLNRYGFHGPDHPPRRRPGSRRIALVGDSMVEAFQVRREETMAARLEEALTDVEVLGFGMAGHSTIRQSKILERLPSLLSDGGAPDLPDCVVFAIHGSYAVQQTLVDYVRPRALWRKGLGWTLLNYRGPSRFLLLERDALLAMLAVPTDDLLVEARRASRPGHESELLARCWTMLEGAVEDLAESARSAGMHPVFAYVPDMSDLREPGPDIDPERVRGRFRDLVAGAGADWVDLTPGFRKWTLSGGRECFFKVDQHLTPAGHAAVGALLAKELLPILDRLPRKH